MARERVTNLPLLVEGMGREGMDAVVAVSPDNFFYTSGKKILSAVSNRDRLAMSLTTLDGATTLVIHRNEEAQTRLDSWVEDLRTYLEFAQSPIAALVEVLEEKGLARSRLGIEKKYLTAAYYEELQRRIPNATLLPCDGVFDRARMIKTRPEIEALRLAAKGTDQAILRGLQGAKRGDTEASLATTMVASLMEIGQGEFRDPSWGVASGPNILVVHYWAGRRRLEERDLVRINLRSAIHEYWSHLYRMAVVGRPGERERSWYEKAKEIHCRAIERMRPGARVSDLFEASKREIEATGVTFRGSLVGHSTGIIRHENPRIQPYDQTVVEPGMVFAVEPHVAIPGFTVFHLEDLVLVTATGPELLSDVTDTERLFVID